jgi:hypothetical protein
MGNRLRKQHHGRQDEGSGGRIGIRGRKVKKEGSAKEKIHLREGTDLKSGKMVRFNKTRSLEQKRLGRRGRLLREDLVPVGRRPLQR